LIDIVSMEKEWKSKQCRDIYIHLSDDKKDATAGFLLNWADLSMLKMSVKSHTQSRSESNANESITSTQICGSLKEEDKE
jgi:hypothetical protein